jgi:hypothetical protein
VKVDPWTVAAGSLVVVVGLAAYPVLGIGGSAFLGATAFFVFTLIKSGYRATRALAWGGLVAVLCGLGSFGPPGFYLPCYLSAGLVFFAGTLSPAFRRLWFDQRIE